MTNPQQPNDDAPGIGRDVRLVTGVVLTLFNLYLLYLDARAGKVSGNQDLILHGMLLVAGLLLIAPTRLMQLLGVIKDKLPIIGGKG